MKNNSNYIKSLTIIERIKKGKSLLKKKTLVK